MDQPDITSLLDHPVLARLRGVLAARPDAIITISDDEGRMWWGSRPGSRHLFHRLPEDYRGLVQFDFVHPDDVAHVRRMFSRALQGETELFTFRASTAEGEWRRVTSVCWAIEVPSGTMMVTITVPAAEGAGLLRDLADRHGDTAVGSASRSVRNRSSPPAGPRAPG